MSDKKHPSRRGELRRSIWWIASWAALVILGLDFMNWGRVPGLYLGLPGWLWYLAGLILAVALVYGLLSRFAWRQDIEKEGE